MEQARLLHTRDENITQMCVRQIRNDDSKHLHVPRIPEPYLTVDETQSKKLHESIVDDSCIAQDHLTKDLESFGLGNDASLVSSRPVLLVDTKASSFTTNPSHKDTEGIANSASTVPASISVTPTTFSSPQSTTSKTSSQVRKVYQEARYLAGGLIHHPSQSTKHYSILRHSYGLVFYQGTTTSLAISIFADAPLPPERTIWLQSKGWTGKAGMRARSLVRWNGNGSM